MTENKQWMVLREPTGVPTTEDVELKTSPIPKAEKDGEIVIKVLWLSLDPFNRGTMNKVSYGREQEYPRVMTGFGTGRVIESKNDKFAVGSLVSGITGWQEYCLVNPSQGMIYPVPDSGKMSYTLSVLGMPGATAYFGFLDICAPKEGEVLCVTAAAGAVGSAVAQIGKIKGCKVIGIAGGDEKCKLVKEKLGADACIDYRGKSKAELVAAIQEASGGKGVDMYFDNVGGVCTEAVFDCLNVGGRVSVCGQIAYYNKTEEDREKTQGTPMTFHALRKQLRVEGFIVSQRWKDWTPAFKEIGAWIAGGQLKVTEDIVEGLPNAFDAFLRLFRDTGKETVNFGKLLVHIADE